jgi:hypothetical protein
MITIPHLNTDCQDPWGDEIPIFGEVDPLEHLEPELTQAVLDTARQLFGLGQDATMVQRRIHAALDGAVRSVTRPDSPMLWKGTPFELARLRANAGPRATGATNWIPYRLRWRPRNRRPLS